MSISPLPPVSKESRVTEGIQFGCGSLSSLVSSRETIFACGVMKSDMALRDSFYLTPARPPRLRKSPCPPKAGGMRNRSARDGASSRKPWTSVT